MGVQPVVRQRVKGTAFIVVLTASLVLLGWGLGLMPLASPVPGLAPMKPNTAVCFLLLGSALWLLEPASGPSATADARRKLLGQACAGLGMFIALATLGEHLFGFNAGIDRLLFPQALLANDARFPGRMAPVTAAGFVAVGLALLRKEAESRKGGTASQYLGFAAACIGFIVLLGYAYGARALYRVTAFSSVSVHTALLLFLLGVAVLCARPDRGPVAVVTGRQPGGLMARRILPAALTLPFLLAWLRLQGERAGLYGLEVGLALFATSNVLIFTGLVWLGARSLNEADARRRQADDRLRQSEERLRMAVAGAGLGSWHWDLRSGELLWSERCLALFGLAPGTGVSYERFLAALHPQDRSRADAAVRRALERRADYDVEYRVLWPDGSLHWLSAKGRGYYDAAGRPVRMEGVVTDVSERKRAEDEQARLAAIVEGSDDAIIGKTLDGFITSWNRGAEQLLGYAANEVLGRAVSVVIPPSRLQEEAELLARIRRGEHVRHYETLRRHKDGRLIDVLLTMSPIRDGTGRITGASSITHDITRRKRAEEELKALNDTLERRVRERTAEAERANRRKSEFLAHMSHELRTPLNAILGFSEVLIDEKAGPLNAKQKEYLTDMLNSGHHLLQLINGVLDLAKVEAGKLQLRLETFPLANALEEVCAVVNSLAAQKGVGLTRTIAPDLGSVSLDEHKLKQICYNLLSNAVKFTGPRGRVELTAFPRDERWFELRVTDTGMGIKPEDLPRLFHAFEQFGTGVLRAEGTGLGLALTKKLIELHGGRIEVQSQYGQGSTFCVVLPRTLAG